MDTNKIKSLAKLRKISIADLAVEIGMSVTGFYEALANNTLKITTLEKIGQSLGVPITYFFKEEEEGFNANESQVNYGKSIDGNITQSIIKSSEQECYKKLTAAEKEIRKLQDKIIQLLEKK